MYWTPSPFTSRLLLAGPPSLDAFRTGSAGGDDEWLTHRAGIGDAWAMETLAARLLRTSESDASHDRGIAYLRAAAALHSPSAMYHLAAVLLEQPSEAARAEGEDWLRRSAATGLTAAVADLGSRLILGEGVTRAIDEGQRLLQEACARRGRLAAVTMAALVLEQHPTDAGAATCARLLELAGASRPDDVADAGLSLYLQALGTCAQLRRGRLTRQAASLFERARVCGSTRGALNLAYLIRRSELAPAGYPSEDALLEPSLQAGHPVAIVNQALRLVSAARDDEAWVAAERLVAGIRQPIKTLRWWTLLTWVDDVEGHVVAAWLARHHGCRDAERVSPGTHVRAARRAGWRVPDWVGDEATAHEATVNEATV